MSQATDAAIGMMDGAYFTSRNEILTFLNTLLDLNLTKIEQTASGAVACQLMEYVFPNSIVMSRVNWSAKASHEYVANYKLLQGAFNKANIQKHIDVDKLIRGKYQDNLEFCQWLKAFFDQASTNMMGGGGRREGYDPIAVRAKGKGGKAVPTGNRVGGGGGARRVAAAAPSSSSVRTARPMGGTTTIAAKRSVASESPRPASGGSSVSSLTRGSAAAIGQKENAANPNNPDPSSSRQTALPISNPRKPASSSSSAAAAIAARYEEEIRALKSENAALEAKYSELETISAEVDMTLQTVESERDFYFEKLRGIEVMLQVYKEREAEVEGSGDVSRVMDRIFKVMYATIEDDVVVDDEGNLVGDITVESSVDKSALLSLKAEDEHDDEDEEQKLVPGGGFDGTTDHFADAPMNDCAGQLEDNGAVNQLYDSDDMDDDNLLTSDLGNETVARAIEPAPKTVEGDMNDRSAAYQDDDDFSDEDLLTD
ncbi:hypothetical protein ACHAXA_003918 [Cyclostephanos tholiformis]|uniref:Uncharacterized protein n=1 Tax=Cyclostephanos tholiformis TaxID=382380 RepID=A0ABD3RE65_9STRA